LDWFRSRSEKFTTQRDKVDTVNKANTVDVDMSKRLTSGLTPNHSATGFGRFSIVKLTQPHLRPVPGKIRHKRNQDTSTKKNKTKRTTSSHGTRDDKQRPISDITKFFPNVQKTNTARINSDDDFEMGDRNVGALFFT
jgi:hypothetical protein